jgi:hypothetical protein
MRVKKKLVVTVYSGQSQFSVENHSGQFAVFSLSEQLEVDNLL